MKKVFHQKRWTEEAGEEVENHDCYMVGHKVPIGATCGKPADVNYFDNILLFAISSLRNSKQQNIGKPMLSAAHAFGLCFISTTRYDNAPMGSCYKSMLLYVSVELVEPFMVH